MALAGSCPRAAAATTAEGLRALCLHRLVRIRPQRREDPVRVSPGRLTLEQLPPTDPPSPSSLLSQQAASMGHHRLRPRPRDHVPVQRMPSPGAASRPGSSPRVRPQCQAPAHQTQLPLLSPPVAGAATPSHSRHLGVWAGPQRHRADHAEARAQPGAPSCWQRHYQRPAPRGHGLPQAAQSNF